MRKMSKKSPIVVLLSIDDRALADRLRGALDNDLFRLVTEDAAKASDRAAMVDVIIVACDEKPKLGPPYLRRIANRDVTVVGIGGGAIVEDAPARVAPAPHDVAAVKATTVTPHVLLPTDVSGRELALACRLLGDNVRLRRKVRRVHRQRRRLAELAETDPLTGLPNRRAWQRELLARLRDPATHGTQQCLAIVDLDYFKRVNDGQGYAEGDRVLTDVARLLREAVRSGDFVARLGGDEFGLLLSHVDQRTAAAVVDRVRVRAGRAAAAGGEAMRLSAGYVVFAPRRGLEHAALLAGADHALREAKRRGRDRAVGPQDP